MNVLLVTQHYPPEVGATGQLAAELAEDLVARGFEVTVLAGRPFYGVMDADGQVPDHEWRNGVEVIRTYCTRFLRTSLPGRTANWLSYSVSSLWRGIVGLRRPDVVLAYSAPPIVPLVGRLLAHRWRARLVLYMQDIYPDIAEAVGAMRNPLLTQVWRALNRFAYRRADSVLTIGNHMEARLGAAGVPPERIAVVHNWADGDRLFPLPSGQNPRREAMGLGNRVVVLYSGNLGMAHDFEPVCKAMVQLRSYRDRLAFVFVGDGARRREVEAFVRQEDLDDLVQFRDYVPQDQLLESLNLGDVALVTLLRGTEGLVVPSKLYAYLAVGMPILAVCPGPCEVSEIVEQARCGLVVNSAEELAEAVLSLLNDADLRAEMGGKARSVFEERFERRKATAAIGEILRNVAQR